MLLGKVNNSENNITWEYLEQQGITTPAIIVHDPIARKLLDDMLAGIGQGASDTEPDASDTEPDASDTEPHHIL